MNKITHDMTDPAHPGHGVAMPSGYTKVTTTPMFVPEPNRPPIKGDNFRQQTKKTPIQRGQIASGTLGNPGPAPFAKKRGK